MLLWVLHASLRAREDARYRDLLITGLAAALIGTLFLPILSLFSSTPKYDLYLYAVDGTLGFSASFELGRALGRSTIFFWPLACVYDAMFVSMLLIYELHVIRKGEPKRVLAALALNLCGGFLLYFLLPACGPAYAFPSLFPQHAPSFDYRLHLLNLTAPPNAIPSLHTSTALLLLWFCRKHPRAGAFAILNLICTLLATLASGEHYLIDLVVGVPFAACVFWASARAWKKAFVWLTVTMGWMGMLRWEPYLLTASPLLLACLGSLTVIAPWASVVGHVGSTAAHVRPSCYLHPVEQARDLP